MNIEHASEDFRATLRKAQTFASERSHAQVGLEHLLLALLEDTDAVTILKRLDPPVDFAALRSEVEQFVSAIPADGMNQSDPPAPSLEVHRAVQRARQYAQNQQDGSSKAEITGAVVLVGMMSERSRLIDSMKAHKITRHDLVRVLAPATVQADAEVEMVETAIQGRRGSSQKGSSLQNYCKNLTQAAREGKLDPVIGRDLEVERTIQILTRRTKNNPVLVGEPGVGKTAVVEGLAQLIVQGKVPARMRNAEVYSLDLGLMLAGARYRGDFEGRLRAMLQEIQQLANGILFIDEIHTLMAAGDSEGGMNAAEMLKPALARGELRCVGATTYKEYRLHIEKDAAMARRFQPVDVDEPTADQAVAILFGLKGTLEQHHAVVYTDAAIQAAVELSVRHIADRKLPDKAIDLMDEAGALRSMVGGSSALTVEVETVQDVIRRKIKGVTFESRTTTENDIMRELPLRLKAGTIGQDKAIDSIVSTVKVARSGFRDHNKPLASLLFVGPQGSGKAHLAEQMCNALGMSLMRLNGADYGDRNQINRLVGATIGFEDSKRGGQLTEHVWRHPNSLILVDGIDNMHPDVLALLCQTMENGFLTDGQTREVDFRQTIFIYTTQAESRERIGFGKQTDPMKDMVDMALAGLQPEFKKNITLTVPFSGLSKDCMASIVDRMVSAMEAQVMHKGVTIEIGSRARLEIAERALEAGQGAGGIGAVLHDLIKVPVAEMIYGGALSKGGTARVEANDDGITVIADPCKVMVKA